MSGDRAKGIAISFKIVSELVIGWGGKVRRNPHAQELQKPLNLNENRTSALELGTICKCHKAPLPSKQAKPISAEKDSIGGS